MATMGGWPHVTHVPTMTGGHGLDGVRAFYETWFIGKWPADTVVTSLSRTIGETGLVDELIISFTHDCEMSALLPGIAPTGRKVTIPFVVREAPRRRGAGDPGRALRSAQTSARAHQCRLRRKPARRYRRSRFRRTDALARGRRRARLERAGLSPHSACGAHPCRSRRRGWGRPHPYCRGLELSRRDVAPRASRSLKFFSEPQYLGTSLGSVCNIPKLSHSIRIGLLTGTRCGRIGAAALLVASVAGSVARPPHFTASLAETWH